MKQWIVGAALLACGANVVAEPPQGEVKRAQFTSAIAEREPVDDVVALNAEQGKVFFFTELLGLQDNTVTHVWEFNGQVVAEKSFNVKGPRWRVFSSKTLLPAQQGVWTVLVKDQNGWPLAVKMFKYGD